MGPRYALFYPCGTITVLSDQASLQDALRERGDADCGMRHRTMIATVSVAIITLMVEDDPTPAPRQKQEVAHG